MEEEWEEQEKVERKLLIMHERVTWAKQGSEADKEKVNSEKWRTPISPVSRRTLYPSEGCSRHGTQSHYGDGR
ncbi:hypothetical protein ACUV84_025739, partial [Puccinellia chinampoensis]